MLSRVVKLSISILFFAICKSTRSILALFKKQIPGTFVVLTYHSIKANQRFAFEKHLDCLGKTGRPVFANVLAPLSNGQHCIAVTFDDGFQSVLENALPAMQKREIPATIFVTTGSLGKKPGWLFETNHMDAAEILMTEAQLRRLPAGLVAVGSHCVTHRNLTHLDGPAVMRELQDSKKILENILARPVEILSFPHGACNERVVDWCRKLGYQRVFVNLPISSNLKTQDYVFGRISVSPQDWQIEYQLKFLGAYQWLPYAVKMKRYLLNHLHLSTRTKQRKALPEC